MNVQEIPVKEIEVGERSRMDVGDLKDLMKSMEERGLINPITVDKDNILICGERRLRSAKKLKWETISCHVVESIEDLMRLGMEKDENECRKPFTAEEAVRAGKRIEALEKLRAKENQSHGQTAPGKRLPSRDGKRSKNKTTSDIAAEKVGMGEASYRRAKRVVEAACEHPENEVLQRIKDELNETGHVFPAYQKTIDELRNIGEVEEWDPLKNAGKKSSGKERRRSHPASTMRAIEQIGFAVNELEKMNVDCLNGSNLSSAYDGLAELRTRISRLLKKMKAKTDEQSDKKKNAS